MLFCVAHPQVFRDPVITPSGFSYERSALLEHLTRVGKFDPISRSPMTESDVTPNVALRNATQHYLDEHPWAWQECI
jgi:STIP1 family protein 1